MGYKIKNITHLLDKSNKNHNKPIFLKIKNRFIVNEYKILPYQELIFDSNLLPIEVKKMEMMGMVKCEPISNGYINNIENPKSVIKEQPKEKPAPKVKKRTTKKDTNTDKETELDK